MRASKGCVRGLGGQRVYPDFTGRQVAVPSEYFNLTGEIYFGTVARWCKYTSAGGKQLWGYDIHYNAGDEWYMIEEDVNRYVRPPADVNDDTSNGNQLADVLGGTDVEHELYLNDGVKPDWMS